MILGGLAILVIGRAFLSDTPLLSRLQSAPVTKIASVIEGEDTRITGVLEYVPDQEVLVAPMSGRRCAAWFLRIEEERMGHKRGRPLWIEVLTESESSGFALVDETGRALVDGLLLDMKLNFDSTSGGRSDPQSEKLLPYLEERGVSTSGLIFGKTLRYREGILEEGERVTVWGAGHWMKDPSAQGASYRDVGQVLEFSAGSDGRVLVSDVERITK